jgi:hypothetical protein
MRIFLLRVWWVALVLLLTPALRGKVAEVVAVGSGGVDTCSSSYSSSSSSSSSSSGCGSVSSSGCGSTREPRLVPAQDDVEASLARGAKSDISFSFTVRVQAQALPVLVETPCELKLELELELDVEEQGQRQMAGATVYLVPVYVGQRVSDAASDFAMRHNLLLDQLFNEGIFNVLCTNGDRQGRDLGECESSESNTILSSFVMKDIKEVSLTFDEIVVDMLIIVRKGYSATQQAKFLCSVYDCSSSTYLRVHKRIAKAMEKAAFDVYFNEPFPLLEGPTLSHLMTYSLSALQDDATAKEFCHIVDKICDIRALCPLKGDLRRVRQFCDFLYSNDSRGNGFFRQIQRAYNSPNSTLVPTGEIYKTMFMFSYTMGFQSELMALGNPIYTLLRVVSNSYLRESFSEHAWTQFIKGDRVSRSTLSFHMEQLKYLAKKAESKELYIYPMSSRPELRSHSALLSFLNPLIRAYQELSAVAEAIGFRYATVYSHFNDTRLTHLLSQALYNRNIYHRPFFPEGFKDYLSNLPKLNPLDDTAVSAINAQFEQEQLVVVDNFLNPEILEELYQYCVESTIWHESEKSLFVGSYWDEGLSHPLMVSVAKEISRVFPFVRGLPLVHMWAYNFDSRKEKTHRSGINKHMDSAIVNINLWLTPDEANLDPKSGGLVVWLKNLFSEEHNPNNKVFPFHEVQDPHFGTAFLAGAEHLNVTISYKRNRVVIFNSALWHATDEYNFKHGHENRRINLTFLFGVNKNIGDA